MANISKINAALKRAATKAKTGTTFERSGRFKATAPCYKKTIKHGRQSQAGYKEDAAKQVS